MRNNFAKEKAWKNSTKAEKQKQWDEYSNYGPRMLTGQVWTKISMLLAMATQEDSAMPSLEVDGNGRN